MSQYLIPYDVLIDMLDICVTERGANGLKERLKQILEAGPVCKPDDLGFQKVENGWICTGKFHVGYGKTPGQALECYRSLEAYALEIDRRYKELTA